MVILGDFKLPSLLRSDDDSMFWSGGGADHVFKIFCSSWF